MARGLSPRVEARTDIGEVSCLCRFRILIGLPFRVGGRRIERSARREIRRIEMRVRAVRSERKRTGARGTRDRILGDSEGLGDS